MRTTLSVVALIASLLMPAIRGIAADEPGIHRVDGFMVKGAFTELDRERTKHRLSLREIEKEGLDGRPRPIDDILNLLASYEKMEAKIDEPTQVRGDIRVTLTPNTLGEEAYTACFIAITYNGLALAGSMGNLILVRPETRPDLAPPKRLWDRNHILSTRLFRLGYLNSSPILARYRDAFGTAEGHAVLEPKSNVVIVTDTDAALEKLGRHIDAEILEAMGAPAPEDARGQQPEFRLPSRGALASREGIHFYLLAYARSNQIPVFAAQQPRVATKSYPEADLWMSDRGFQSLEQEYRRIGEARQLSDEAVAQGWVDPHPQRALTEVAQKRLEIRFGLVSPLPGRAAAQGTAKKAARRKRP
jgi:hypothetical protein